MEIRLNDLIYVSVKRANNKKGHNMTVAHGSDFAQEFLAELATKDLKDVIKFILSQHEKRNPKKEVKK